ncbi:hypothetical protein V8B97DRAFT_1967591 [Scleroderma yunnanense]
MAKKSAQLDFSIPGDELEYHRIQLEHNLQNTDLSFHLSSVPDEADGDIESVEYPRHHSAPSPFPGFTSFEQHSRENFDYDGHSHLHPWSMHDDDGVNPYSAETMSTVAHHASAVTITAGLGRNQRREPNLSGAEYDPDRPLQDIMAGMDTAEAASLAARLRSPKPLHDVSASEDTDRSQEVSRPKLAESLQRVGFSPRRPRSVQTILAHQSPRMAQDPLRRYADISRRSMTPKARKASAVSFDTTVTPVRRHVSQPVAQPQVNVQPPTPSMTVSNATKMVRGQAKDVRQTLDLSQTEGAVDDEYAYPPVSISRHSLGKDITNRHAADVTGDLNHFSRSSKKSTRGRIHLPDVTGLTNAVVSPAKATLDRYAVRGSGSREVEARLVASLNSLHVRLSHLENENSIARRRVRELEYELEECKRDVVRERTRILESQDAIDVNARLPGPSTLRAKGKEKKVREADQSTSKYFEIVEEKKALEALISTLRSHLTRVTQDLSSQQQLLEDLRRLRESDALSLSEKTDEINQLRKEIERLAGEIEVLRGVVEEGLNERRQAKESAGEEQNDSEHSAAQSEQPDTSAAENMLEKSTLNRISRPSTPTLSLRRSMSETSHHLNCSRPESPAFTEHSHVPSGRKFINSEEINRISADLEERRSERSSNASTSSGNGSRNILSVVTSLHTEIPRSRRRDLQPQVEDEVEDELQPVPSAASAPEQQTTKSHAPALDLRQRPKDGKKKASSPVSNPPFPRISADLERMFFSAARHNTNACRMCKDRRSKCRAKEINSQRNSEGSRQEGKEDVSDAGELSDASNSPSHEVAGPEGGPSIEDILERMDLNGALTPGEIPPQTVLARVLRELEDEFTHHKEIYRELAEEYRVMDCATQAAKRHMVADHLRDVIGTIERKGDQITSLYELLTFKDRPIVN